MDNFFYDKEVFFDNSQIKIKNKDFDLHNIKLKIYTKELPENVIWVKFFIYKLLRLITIEVGGQLIFQTNGLFIKSKIEVFNENENYKLIENGYISEESDLKRISKKENEFEIPLFLFDDIPLKSIDREISITVETNEWITMPKMIHIPFKIAIVPIFGNGNLLPNKIDRQVSINNMECIKIDDELKEITHVVRMGGLLNHLIIYINGSIVIETVQFFYNDIVKCYSFDDLNKILPFYYLGKCLPKNFLFISFSKYQQGGINYDRFYDIRIRFRFLKNDGGNIYLMSEAVNFILLRENYFGLRYSSAYRFDNIMEQAEELLEKKPKNNVCLICYTQFQTGELYDECENCICAVHKSCIKQWRQSSNKQKCPFCQINKGSNIYRFENYTL